MYDNMYNISVNDMHHATEPAFTHSTPQSATLDKGTGNISMSFNSWVGNETPYTNLTEFNTYNNVDIFNS